MVLFAVVADRARSRRGRRGQGQGGRDGAVLLDDVPSEVHPAVGLEEREGCRGGVACARGGARGGMALPGMPVEENRGSERILVSSEAEACILDTDSLQGASAAPPPSPSQLVSRRLTRAQIYARARACRQY